MSDLDYLKAVIKSEIQEVGPYFITANQLLGFVEKAIYIKLQGDKK